MEAAAPKARRLFIHQNHTWPFAGTRRTQNWTDRMSGILLGIWTNAPVWIWPLFFVLVFIGIMAMRTRNSSIIPYFFYPLFGLSAANAIIGLAHSPAKFVIFGACYVIGAAIAFRWQDGLILHKTGWKMRLKGDRITILILMAIFFSNFVNGVVQSVSPQLAQMLAFTIIFAGVIGACSGSFTGRALRVLTFRSRVTSDV